MNKRALALLVIGLPALALAACGGEDEPTPAPAPDAAETPQVPLPDVRTPPAGRPTATPAPRSTAIKTYSAPPPMTIDPGKSYTATIQLATRGGEIVIELFPKEAPKTVNNFVFLSREGFYDGVTFHRVLADFMAQSGDPTGTGSGGPGYNFQSELSPLRRHDSPGVLSMANSGGTNTNGSQFFITFIPTPFLDGYDAEGNLKPCNNRGVSCHTVFGKVVEGMDVVFSITLRDPGSATPGDAIKTITIEEGE